MWFQRCLKSNQNQLKIAKNHCKLPEKILSDCLGAGCRGFKSLHSDHVVADCISFATTFSFSKQTSSLAHSVAPPFQIATATLGCNLVVDADTETTASILLRFYIGTKSVFRTFFEKRTFLFWREGLIFNFTEKALPAKRKMIWLTSKFFQKRCKQSLTKAIRGAIICMVSDC